VCIQLLLLWANALGCFDSVDLYHLWNSLSSDCAIGYAVLWSTYSRESSPLFGFATGSDNVEVGSAIGNTYHNVPFVIMQYYMAAGLLTALMVSAI